MAFGSSPAENLFDAWHTKAVAKKVNEDGIKAGHFETFLKGNGFKPLIDGLLKLYTQNGTDFAGEKKTLEQVWKLVDKVKNRCGLIVAYELTKALKKVVSFTNMLESVAADYSPTVGTSTKAQRKINAGRATWEELTTLHFANVNKTVQIIKMLGKGGMGGAVYLGIDQHGNKFAVKHFPGDYKAVAWGTIDRAEENLRQKIAEGTGDIAQHKRDLARWKRIKSEVKKKAPYKGIGGTTLSPIEARARVDRWLYRFAEGAMTPTCLDLLQRGSDQYLLLALGEGDVDWSDLTLADIVAVFQDLDTVEHYARHFMEVELTQEVSVLHLDIHGGNMMRFNGRLRLIDFGKALLYSPDVVQGLAKLELQPFAKEKFNKDDYLTGTIEDSKMYTDPESGSPAKYIADWRGYAAAPMVRLCKGCNRQHPDLLSVVECMACGSKNIVRERIRRVDLENNAKLKKVPVDSLLVGPYKTAKVPSLTPSQYGCIVLTAVLIKETWVAMDREGKLNTGIGKNAKGIENVVIYSTARKLMPKLRAASPGQALLIELLLLWFDEMMRRLFAGEPFGAADAVRYFQPVKKKVSRGRAMSI
ncbi:MAG: hypothetical protein IPI35_16375 [Deltaproteobacteria bacterium]|nr:hypothetical protein [Deltaproteobacteria bacterium]